ncbi:MAG TPA: FAD-dependent 5-carboxymethylaminomethyl-2-thiouridine(34) oxidoreductase MnmC [Caldimonas sp.]|nr:FAD-dependent 5-carboxymethylaminomethyl-2-thiouridine(34) oxidoreductase MnmC [Caldimonas sp.]
MNPASALRVAALPQRWRARERCVLVAVGAASAPALQAAIDAWRGDPWRCTWLHVVLATPASSAGIDGASVPEADWSMRRSDGDGLQCLLVPAADAESLRQLVARADVLFLSPPANVERTSSAMSVARSWATACARLTAADATVIADAASTPLHAALGGAGFLRDAAGSHTPHETCLAYRRDARVPLRVAAAWQPEDDRDRRALIVGGGLAGCASAWGLAMLGWRCTVLEAAGELGGTVAAQPSAVFHPLAHAHDSRHARHARAAAREAREAVEVACTRHGALGAADGLLQCVQDAEPARESRCDAAVGSDRMSRLDAAAASALAGTSITRPACWQADGGWVRPQQLARSFLERAGSAVDTRFDMHVQAIERVDGIWRVCDRAGRRLAEAPTLVLANAADAFRLLGGHWPVTSVRGQSSIARLSPSQAMDLPRLPLAGGGYLAPTGDGRIVFGATAHAGDGDPQVRREDHVANLTRLSAMAPALAHHLDVDALEGRVGWRCVARDRLPVVGRAPDGSDTGRRDIARLVPRRPGLFVHAALASRGVAWCALDAQVLAALATGTPVPLAADLLESIDPARFAVRDHRRPARAEGG